MNFKHGDSLIGVDGGGTGCRFALIHDGKRTEHRGGPANVRSDFDGATATLRQGLGALAENAGLTLADISGFRTYMGLAGVTGPKLAARVAHALPLTRIRIEEDQHTAVIGALEDRDGLVIGIGTGSFLARRAQGSLRFIGGWGLILGDEASGAAIGRRLLQLVLHSVDGVIPATALTAQIIAEFDGNPTEIVKFAAKAKPADFAEFAPRIVTAAPDDAIAGKIMAESADYISHGLKQLGWQSGEAIFPIGGLAACYSGFLPQEMADNIVPPAGSALDGALILAKEI